MKTNDFILWGTVQELHFLDTVGRYGRDDRENYEPDPQIRRHRCLVGYLKSMENRKDWGSIDPVRVKNHVEALIKTGE